MESASFEVATAIYPLDVIYTAAYVFLDRAYIALDGDEKNVRITLEPKTTEDANALAKELRNELLVYSHHKELVNQNKAVRETLLQRALITGIGADPADDYLDDPEGIAIPWEEKYGKHKDKQG